MRPRNRPMTSGVLRGVANADVGDAKTLDEVDAVLARLVDSPDAGFVDLVRTYQKVVYSVALHACGQSFDAEDLAAETFLRAYSALRGYDRQRILALRPRPWLLTILLNTWRNWCETRADGPIRCRSANMLTIRRKPLAPRNWLCVMKPSRS
jgi:DNA-directed RNA polymerase specialized sigma24 family protein